jgi:DNA anti-recombination protein RmuC
MKRFQNLIGLLGLALLFPLFSACDNSSSSGEKLERASELVADAFRSEKEEMIADLENTQQDIEDEMTKLQEEMKESSLETGEVLQKRMAMLNDWKEEVEADIKMLQEATENEWKEVKVDIMNSMDTINQKLDETLQG